MQSMMFPILNLLNNHLSRADTHTFPDYHLLYIPIYDYHVIIWIIALHSQPFFRQIVFPTWTKKVYRMQEKGASYTQLTCMTPSQYNNTTAGTYLSENISMKVISNKILWMGKGLAMQGYNSYNYMVATNSYNRR